jgi:DNA-binding response OmpR family regulator
MKARVLFAEDDPNVAAVTKRRLEECGYEVYHAYDGEGAWQLFNEKEVDICLLDVVMPRLNGLALAVKIRRVDDIVPILFLTSKSMLEDKIEGFKTSADDYITRPVSVQELCLRIEVFLRRTKLARSKMGHYNIGAYILNVLKCTLMKDGISVRLSAKEVNILHMLIENMKDTVSKESIIEKVWGREKVNCFTERSLEVFISKIRKRLKDDRRVEIENIRNVGYRLQIFNGID